MKTETIVGIFIIAAVAVFLYMSYQIGSFRFDRMNYNAYTMYFNDVSGLSRKADIKIAGVKVGWVDDLQLINDGQQVKAILMINRNFIIHADAYGIVRQEGFLGTKHLEVIPGDPQLPSLPSGSMLTRPNKNPVTIDEMMQQFSEIATNIQSVVQSLNKAIGGEEGESKVRTLVSDLEHSMKNFASFANRIDRLVANNEASINSILHNLQENLPGLITSLRTNIEKVSQVMDRDFGRMATQFEEGIAPLRETLTKINTGQGILGQLITDESAADDLRTAIGGIKTYFDKIDRMRLIFDIHTESMSGPIEERLKTYENKAYMNLRLHTSEDYFYMVGLVASRNGRIDRFDEVRSWYNDECNQLIPDEMHLDDGQKLRFAKFKRFKIRALDKLLWNVQFGKIFGNFAFRFGLFDSTGGVGMDIDLPLGVANMRWVTTLEAWDFSGVNRMIDEYRPHLKWLNRLFFTRNIYFTFGADDFISKFNKNAFFGVGLRFADDDIKYLLSRLIISTPV